MTFESPDLTASNVEKIAVLFPNCVTEARGEDGKLKKAVNFDLLRQMLSDDVAEGDEAYEFTWVGKKAAIVEANRPIRKTLRPCKEESVDWDTTENLYIEGDNLEVLKLLQESYLGKVKLIYIDPPYNTGGDFIYRDDFKINQDDYDEQWTDAFIETLMSSSWKDAIAADWSVNGKRNKRTQIKGYIVGLLTDAGVLKGSYDAIARKIDPTDETRRFSRYMSQGKKQPFAQWVMEYITVKQQ